MKKLSLYVFLVLMFCNPVLTETFTDKWNCTKINSSESKCINTQYGDVYVGEVLNNKPNGKGIIDYKDDKLIRAEGIFSSNNLKIILIEGTIAWSDGSTDFYKNKKKYKTKVIYPEGFTIEGIRDKNNNWTEATKTSASGGNKFFGSLSNNGLPKKGTYYFSNGNEFVGTFSNDTKKAKGTFNLTNGDKYVGSSNVKSTFDESSITFLLVDGVYHFANGLTLKFVNGEQKKNSKFNIKWLVGLVFLVSFIFIIVAQYSAHAKKTKKNKFLIWIENISYTPIVSWIFTVFVLFILFYIMNWAYEGSDLTPGAPRFFTDVR